MPEVFGISRYVLVFCLLIIQGRSESTGSDNIRLVGGTAFAGRVEVLINDVWGTVCDDSWDLKDASVACRELGFPGGAVASYEVAAFGQGIGSIHLDDLNCTGSENSLQNCSRAETSYDDCTHSEDAAVMCQNPALEIKPDLLNTGSCGRRPALTRIVNGQNADVGEWPWSGYLAVESTFFCGAVLINNEWAITAAHCERAFGYIVFGDIAMSSNTATHQQSDVTMYCHPNYDEENFDNDICLLKLHTHVNYNDNVQPVCFGVSKQELNTYPAGSCYVIGWGSPGFGINSADHLQELATSLITNSKCNEPYGHITDNMICSSTGATSGSCQGDSGGPLMCNNGDGEWHLVGVTSHGYECADISYPDVLARVSRYSQWIRQTVDIWHSLPVEALTHCYSCSYLEIDGRYDQRDWTNPDCKDSPHLAGYDLCQENCATVDYTYTFTGLFGITSLSRVIVRGCTDTLYSDTPSPGRCFTGSRFDSWYINWDEDAEELSFFDFDDLDGSICTCANNIRYCEVDSDGGYSTKVLPSGLMILLMIMTNLYALRNEVIMMNWLW